MLEDLGASYRLVTDGLADHVTFGLRHEGNEELNHETTQEHAL